MKYCHPPSVFFGTPSVIFLKTSPADQHAGGQIDLIGSRGHMRVAFPSIRMDFKGSETLYLKIGDPWIPVLQTQ